MGFVNPQVDLIDNRFFFHRVKTLDVFFSESEQAEATPLVVALPATIFDALGNLLGTISIVPVGDPVTTIQTLCNAQKVADTFTQTFNVILTPFTGGAPIVLVTGAVITASDFVFVPGLCQGPGVPIIQKHDVQGSFGFALTGTVAAPTLTVTYAVTFDLVVARETILKVNAAEIWSK